MSIIVEKIDSVRDNKTKNTIITHVKKYIGWTDVSGSTLAQADFINRIEGLVYLGNCKTDGDCFAVYTSGGYISFCKGKLNNGIFNFNK